MGVIQGPDRGLRVPAESYETHNLLSKSFHMSSTGRYTTLNTANPKPVSNMCGNLCDQFPGLPALSEALNQTQSRTATLLHSVEEILV